MNTLLNHLNHRQFSRDGMDSHHVLAALEKSYSQSCKLEFLTNEDEAYDLRSSIAVGFSCDGAYYASTHGDHTIRICHANTSELYKVLRGNERTPWAIKFHPSNPNVLVSGDLDGVIRIWNLETDTSSVIFRPHLPTPCHGMDYHPTRNLVSIAYGGGCVVLLSLDVNWKSTALSSLCIRNRKAIRGVRFHPRGNHLLVFSPTVEDPQNCDIRYLRIPETHVESVQVVDWNFESLPVLQRKVIGYNAGAFDLSKDGSRIIYQQNITAECPRPQFRMDRIRCALDGTLTLEPICSNWISFHRLYGVSSIRFMLAESHVFIAYGIRGQYDHSTSRSDDPIIMYPGNVRIPLSNFLAFAQNDQLPGIMCEILDLTSLKIVREVGCQGNEINAAECFPDHMGTIIAFKCGKVAIVS